MDDAPDHAQVSPDAPESIGSPLAAAPDNGPGFAPELGGALRGRGDRTGFEPELGGLVRQKGVYVDEITCIGCKNCAHVARNTFYIEPEYGRARAIRQDGDSEELVQEAIDTCPVNCIHWVAFAELKRLEEERRYQEIPLVGFPIDKSVVAANLRRRKEAARKRRTAQD